MSSGDPICPVCRGWLSHHVEQKPCVVMHAEGERERMLMEQLHAQGATITALTKRCEAAETVVTFMRHRQGHEFKEWCDCLVCRAIRAYDAATKEAGDAR